MPSQALVRSIPCRICHCGKGRPCRTWTPRARRKYKVRHAHHIERVRDAQHIQRVRRSAVKS